MCRNGEEEDPEDTNAADDGSNEAPRKGHGYVLSRSPWDSPRRYVPSTNPHRGQRGPASRVRIVVEHLGQRHRRAGSHAQGQTVILRSSKRVCDGVLCPRPGPAEPGCFFISRSSSPVRRSARSLMSVIGALGRNFPGRYPRCLLYVCTPCTFDRPHLPRVAGVRSLNMEDPSASPDARGGSQNLA